MRVGAVRALPARLEFARPYVTARGTISFREIVELHVELGDLVGHGETTSLSLRDGPPAEEIVTELEGAGTRCLQEAATDRLEELADPVRAAQAVGRMTASCLAAGLSRQALCAIDLALFDLAGKLCGVPVWKLLGAGRAEPVRCNATLIAAEPEAVAADARAWAAEGFTSFKIKTGVPGDVEAVRSVRRAVGADASIRIDSNGAWDAETALRRLDAMGGATELELAEQPCADLAELARLREQCEVRIAADESVVDPDTAAALVRLGAAEIATVKLAKVGGFAAALEVAQQLPVYVSSALDGPIGITAGAHLARALGHRGGDAGIAHGLATERLFAGWPGGGARLEGDLLHPPEIPGLGVEIRTDAGYGRGSRSRRGE